MTTETDADTGVNVLKWADWNHDAESDYDRVARGIDWLHEHGPTYDCDVNRIEPGHIEMQFASLCVLGQAGGGFHRVMARDARARTAGHRLVSMDQGLAPWSVSVDGPRRNGARQWSMST